MCRDIRKGSGRAMSEPTVGVIEKRPERLNENGIIFVCFIYSRCQSFNVIIIYKINVVFFVVVLCLNCNFLIYNKMLLSYVHFFCLIAKCL